MAKAVTPVPEGFHTVTPHLVIKGAAAAIDFYKRAFGAEVVARMDGPGGTVGHAELKIGDSIIFLADEFPGGPTKSPQTLGGTHGQLAPLRSRCGCRLQTGDLRRRPRNHGRHRHVLGRPLRATAGPVRPQLVDRHPQGNPDPAGDRAESPGFLGPDAGTEEIGLNGKNRFTRGDDESPLLYYGPAIESLFIESLGNLSVDPMAQ